MAIFTRSQFATIAQSKAGTKGLKGFVNESKLFSRTSQSTSIFLSHSHTDKDVVEQAVTFFRTLGINIYVDWADETMPEKPNGETAQKIKGQIVINDKFILLATNSAVASKWCNWEVGIGDTYKLRNKKIALLPLSDNSGTWNGNEYLQIYPRIEKGNSNPNDYYVWYPDNTCELLTTWLNR
ncbi:MAG TPA: toll/interleukin-1 receptor domain-containing protein [Bacteroidales bacterium]|jgi:hypothetical protein|nr:toll/interleukin-1 receptor domain-containing protein [Bacteroidales bacterium]